MDQKTGRDDILFEALDKSKKKKKRKIIRTVVIILVILALGLTAGVLYLRRQVTKRFASSDNDVVSAEATIGSISTQVSGSGTLVNVDEESITVPAGVGVEEIMVAANDSVTEGQLIAKVDLASVQSAMSSVREEMESLDSDITTASKDTVSTYITAGVAGRVKKIYAAKGDDVAKCMYENGALAILSLDGYMAIDIEAGSLQPGEKVTVVRANGSKVNGSVDTVVDTKATILVKDDGPELDEEVTVLNKEGSTIGEGKLYIHSAFRITGISGTVSNVYVKINKTVNSGAYVFSLKNISYTAKYQTLLRDREKKEKTLIELMDIYRLGGVAAPFDGTIVSVDYDEEAVVEDAETALFTISNDEQMEVTINVDESNILSLELGQTATITVSSIGDTTFSGSVTEINKTASSSSGVTKYTAVVTLDKTPEMLQGMSAKVVVRIEGVENAVIIPIDALHQTSSTSYVYTSYDEETQEFGGLVEVTVGITNSSYAEITSGLKEGDTVYYTKKQTSMFGGMSFGGSFPGGDSSGSGFSGGFPGGSGSGSGGFPGGSGSGSGGFPGGGGSGSGGSGSFPGGSGVFPGNSGRG